MPSEKSRYRKKYVEVAIDHDAVQTHWLKKDKEELVSLLINLSDYNFTLRRILFGCASLEQAQTKQEAKLAIDFIFDIQDWVPQDQCGDFSLIFESLKKSICHIAERDSDLAKSISEYAYQKSETVSELFDDNWAWEEGRKILSPC